MTDPTRPRSSPPESDPGCRLCRGSLKPAFSARVLGKHDVAYFRCVACGSLQTEAPYWLDEAYGQANLANSDTGAAQRNLHNLTACLAISRLLKTRNVIDVGGGDGLLCRLLRDHGINCYVNDKYAAPTYGQGFTEPDFQAPDLVIAFEVVEHYPNPASDLRALFAGQPKAVLLSTAIYGDEGPDWWYLAPESGQHVFFYSRQAVDLIARTYGYECVVKGGFILFMKDPSAYTRFAARKLLKSLTVRLLKALVVLLPTPGVWQDHQLQVERSRREQAQHRV